MQNTFGRFVAVSKECGKKTRIALSLSKAVSVATTKKRVNEQIIEGVTCDIDR